MRSELALWVSQFPSVQLWLEGIAEGTRSYYLRTFYEFCTEGLKNDPVLVGMTPERLVEFQETAMGRERYRILNCAQVLIQRQGKRLRTKKTHLSAIRSFFLHVHCELPSDRGFRLKSDIAAVCGRLSVEDFRKVLFKCNAVYRAVYVTMFQGGLGAAELVYVNEHLSGYILEQIALGERRIRLTLAGRKQNRNVKPYPTMIGKDAIDCIKEVMHLYKRHGLLFVNEFGHPLSEMNITTYFHSACLRAGVLKPKPRPCKHCGQDAFPIRRQTEGVKQVMFECHKCGKLTLPSDYCLTRKDYGAIRYDIGAHEIRDTYKSEWHYSGADLALADLCMGHTVDPLLYDKVVELHPEYLDEQFRIAEPFLNILSGDAHKVSRTEFANELESSKQRIEELTEQVKVTQLSEEDRVFLSKKTEILDALQRIEQIEKKLSKE
jgi:hypothetical protein